MHGDDKLNALDSYPVGRRRGPLTKEKLTELEQISFMPTTDSTASPFCSFYTSYFQQKISSCRFSALLAQFGAQNILKKHGTLSKYIGSSYMGN